MGIANSEISYRFRDGAIVDNRLLLQDVQETFTSAGANVTQVATADAQIDLFDTSVAPPNNQLASIPEIEAWAEISAIDAASGDEGYLFQVEESDTTAFTVVRNTHNLNLLDDVAGNTEELGKIVLTFRPQYRFLRFNFFLSGTSPSVTIDLAGISPRHT